MLTKFSRTHFLLITGFNKHDYCMIVLRPEPIVLKTTEFINYGAFGENLLSYLFFVALL